jgi:hypothetical protein
MTDRLEALDARVKAAERQQEALALGWAALCEVVKEAAQEPQEGEESDG